MVNSDQKAKNNFVLSLRDRLATLYGTEHHYTPGEGDFEARETDGVYCWSSVRRDPSKPKDINAFFFRKDLCAWILPETVVYEKINSFANSRGIESKLKIRPDGTPSLTLKFGKEEYQVQMYTGEGYAADIRIGLHKCYSVRLEDNLRSVGNL